MPKKRVAHSHESTEETQRCILEAAHRLFMEYGYRAVTTRLVAQHCKISQPTLYYHFTDKQSIFVEITMRLLNTMQTELLAIAGSNKNGETKLTEAASFLLHYAGREMNVNSLLHDIEHEVDETTRTNISQTFFSHVIEPLVIIITEIQLDTPPIDTSRQLSVVNQAFVFLSMITTLADQTHQFEPQQNNKNVIPSSDLAQQLTKFYLHGLQGS